MKNRRSKFRVVPLPAVLFGIVLLAAAIIISVAACETGVDDGYQITPVDIEEVLISKGTFMMGTSDFTTDEAEANRMALRETPKHQVTLTNDFYMGKYPVTQAEYRAVMGKNPSFFQGANIPAGVNWEKLPVETVSWYDAVEFCNKLSAAKGLFPAYTIDKNTKDPDNTNSSVQDPRWTVTVNIKASGYRLPTEAEWEYACRAGTTTPFSLGVNESNVDIPGTYVTTNQANFDGTQYNTGDPVGPAPLRRTSEVGSYRPNKWGLYDMHGNVYEWCWDRIPNDAAIDVYDNYYADKYKPGNATDPLGLPRADRRVERGGSWNHPAFRIRSAWRERAQGWRSGPDLGFRVVRTAN